MKRIYTALLALLTTTAFSATLVPVQLLNPSGSTSGQAIVSTGASTAPTWGSVAASALAAQAANTVVANVTGSSASPTAFSMPSCSTSSSVLQWTSGTGFNCFTGINANSLQTFTWAIPGTIGSTTPSSGAFTTLSATSTITPSQTAGIVGTTTNNNANAGSVGEFPAPTNLSGVALTTTVAVNLSSVSLTAGDWDVQCTGKFTQSGSSNITASNVGISTTSATLGADGTLNTNGYTQFPLNATNVSPINRVSLSGTTTVYCVGSAVFGAGTATASGFLRERRVR